MTEVGIGRLHPRLIGWFSPFPLPTMCHATAIPFQPSLLAFHPLYISCDKSNAPLDPLTSFPVGSSTPHSSCIRKVMNFFYAPIDLWGSPPCQAVPNHLSTPHISIPTSVSFHPEIFWLWPRCIIVRVQSHPCCGCHFYLSVPLLL